MKNILVLNRFAKNFIGQVKLIKELILNFTQINYTELKIFSIKHIWLLI